MRQNVVFFSEEVLHHMNYDEIIRQTMLQLIELNDKLTNDEFNEFKGIIDNLILDGENDPSFRKE